MILDTYDKLKEILLNRDKEELEKLLDSTYPIDIATALEEFEDDEILTFYNLSDIEYIAKVLEQSKEELQIRIVSVLNFNEISKAFSYMSNDDITDIMGYLPFKMRKDLLKLMKKGDANIIQDLLGYDEDSAGGIMTTEYIALRGELTIENSIKKIKEIGPQTEVIEIIFVLNENGELVGTADLRSILLAKEDELLRDVTDYNVISVPPEEDQEEVSLLVSKYDLKVVPVVNRKNALLGIITVDDIIDVIVEEHTEDMLRLGGVSEEERTDNRLITSIRKRLPWLFVNLGTAFLASFTVGLFEDVISRVVALAAAMPIVAGMGGNSGTQTLSLVIRGIALGEMDLKDDWKLVFKEIMLGLINGAVIGIIAGSILYLRYGNPYLGLIIFFAMIGNLIIAGFFGFIIPLILKKIGVDPALASSIFLTTATDVFGFFIFLGLAKVFIELLI